MCIAHIMKEKNYMWEESWNASWNRSVFSVFLKDLVLHSFSALTLLVRHVLIPCALHKNPVVVPVSLFVTAVTHPGYPGLKGRKRLFVRSILNDLVFWLRVQQIKKETDPRWTLVQRVSWVRGINKRSLLADRIELSDENKVHRLAAVIIHPLPATHVLFPLLVIGSYCLACKWAMSHNALWIAVMWFQFFIVCRFAVTDIKTLLTTKWESPVVRVR